jgi:hypothetical protein
MIASEILRIFLIILTSYAGAHPRDVSTYRGSAVFIFANAKTVREYVVQAAAKLLCGITVCYHKRFPSFLSIVGGARRKEGDGSVSPPIFKSLDKAAQAQPYTHAEKDSSPEKRVEDLIFE